MLRNRFVIYAIETSKSEYKSSYDEFFDTFEDALNATKNYEDWYCSKGDCKIVKLIFGEGKTYNKADCWRIKDGQVVSKPLFY